MTGNSLTFLRGPVVYVCRDMERALGLPLSTQNYFIITNSSAFAKSVAAKNRNILLIVENAPLDTRDLLAHPKTAAWLNRLPNPKILVFKNTTQIEKLCRDKGWQLLNPPAELAKRVEEKISQLTWLGPLQKYLPPHKVMLCKDLEWSKKKLARHRTGGSGAGYIVQFNHAHTGLGTILINSAQSLVELKKKFPKRSVRVTDFVSGPALTNNNVVWGKHVLIGNINYQITGLAPFTKSPFTTVGNDWALPKHLMQSKQIRRFKQIATNVGKKLAKDGWRGLFGIDTILDEKTDKLYLIEINARQPASTTFESQLQENKKTIKQKNNATTFEAHLAALLGLPYKKQKLIAITDGAQIIQRIPNTEQQILNTEYRIPNHKRLAKRINGLKDCKIIEYENTTPGSDWLRIQSKAGIMAGHNKFNKLGKNIQNDTYYVITKS
ncbi:MAG: ATP-grasp domain-containing protein [Candidatus Magasanikbacteria bacterium]|nr:ATP-grasp domain-containing protein [Candidatus Magasanikbacteria bacterium]